MAITITGRFTQTGKSSVSLTPSSGGGEIGIFSGGQTTLLNVIDYITISSTGNALDFGDLTLEFALWGSGTSNGVNERGVWGGGNNKNIITYITISTLGNDTDFGDLTVGRYGLGATSNGQQ